MAEGRTVHEGTARLRVEHRLIVVLGAEPKLFWAASIASIPQNELE
jgi:hypothetical protein